MYFFLRWIGGIGPSCAGFVWDTRNFLDSS